MKHTIRRAAAAASVVAVVGMAPFTAFAQEDDEGDDDDENTTPAPSEVNTGDAVPGDDDTMLLVTAGALTALAGGAFALRRKLV